jgi:formylglycine-generating enzyme required for sulfatase activity
LAALAFATKFRKMFFGMNTKVRNSLTPKITMTKRILPVFLVCLFSLPISFGQEVRKAGERMTLKINDVEYAFRWCPPGTFTMGEEKSQHQVTLTKGFWMLETPVTQSMWEKVIGNNPSNFKGATLPVENVSWNDCQDYIKKLNDARLVPAGYKFALPTEAQWEYACRAGTTTAYHFGHTLTKEQANFAGNKTTEVGKYPANAWGLKDMHGNVCEWCADWYGNYPAGAVTDPTGAAQGSNRVIRGGDCGSHAVSCRSARRFNNYPFFKGNPGGFGLRLCLVSE